MGQVSTGAWVSFAAAVTIRPAVLGLKPAMVAAVARPWVRLSVM